MKYDWRFGHPSNPTLNFHLENHEESAKVFDATMSLKPKPLSPFSALAIAIQFPFPTVKVAVGIYWNALKLWIKGVPFYAHPKTREEDYDRSAGPN
jgi:DUF1365 family protein